MTKEERDKAALSALSRRPLRLASNRVWRTYGGGRLIEAWQGRADAADGDRPEEWVASTVRARNAGREHLEEGYSRLAQPEAGDDAGESRGDGGIALRELVSAAPEAFLGRRHAQRFGDNPGVLVKVLDAAERLTIQVHPSREFAMRRFGSPFGKTEAWYAIGGRDIDGEEPYVLFGFKPGTTRETWRRLFEAQDIEGMIDALHRVPIRDGDVFLIEGGVPHAIGSGCFLIEIQEPTDLTLRTERATPRGAPIPDAACHQGIGFEGMLDCFRYEALSFEETMARWKKRPRKLAESEGGCRTELIGAADTDRFRMERVVVERGGRMEAVRGESFAIVIVLSGEGAFETRGETYAARQADQWFVPAGVADLAARNDGAAPFELIVCYPPPAAQND